MSQNSPDRKAGEILQRTQQLMVDAIRSAVETAGIGAAKELAEIGINYRRPARDHYSMVALHSLFLDHCKADPQTSKGGDPKRAARILHIGGKISRHWESENADPALRDKRESTSLSEEDEKDRADWASAAERVALKTVLRILVDHASVADPGIRDRIAALLDAFVAGLDPQAEQTHAIAEFARGSVAAITRSPASSASPLGHDADGL